MLANIERMTLFKWKKSTYIHIAFSYSLAFHFILLLSLACRVSQILMKRNETEICFIALYSCCLVEMICRN